MPCQTGFDSSVHLAYGDVTINSASNPTALEVNLKSSKTDSFRKGPHLLFQWPLCSGGKHGIHGGSWSFSWCLFHLR